MHEFGQSVEKAPTERKFEDRERTDEQERLESVSVVKRQVLVLYRQSLAVVDLGLE